MKNSVCRSKRGVISAPFDGLGVKQGYPGTASSPLNPQQLAEGAVWWWCRVRLLSCVCARRHGRLFTQTDTRTAHLVKARHDYFPQGVCSLCVCVCVLLSTSDPFLPTQEEAAWVQVSLNNAALREAWAELAEARKQWHSLQVEIETLHALVRKPLIIPSAQPTPT